MRKISVSIVVVGSLLGRDGLGGDGDLSELLLRSYFGVYVLFYVLLAEICALDEIDLGERDLSVGVLHWNDRGVLDLVVGEENLFKLRSEHHKVLKVDGVSEFIKHRESVVSL